MGNTNHEDGLGRIEVPTGAGKTDTRNSVFLISRKESFLSIYLELLRGKRSYQDDNWGGANHDDEHSTLEFFALIEQQIQEGKSSADYRIGRERLFDIAALAIAAAQSSDRKRYGFMNNRNYDFNEWLVNFREAGIIFGLFNEETKLLEDGLRENYDAGMSPLEAVFGEITDDI